jgi:hypothetical protein
MTFYLQTQGAKLVNFKVKVIDIKGSIFIKNIIPLAESSQPAFSFFARLWFTREGTTYVQSLKFYLMTLLLDEAKVHKCQMTYMTIYRIVVSAFPLKNYVLLVVIIGCIMTIARIRTRLGNY